MGGQELVQILPSGIEAIVTSNLASDETVSVRLKGAFKEALVCTDRRVLIAKAGFMTGQMFGSDVFQLSYGTVTSAQVKFGILSGYFEVYAGGMQNTDKNYWSLEKHSDAKRAPNCVTLNSKAQAAIFRSACSYIMEIVESARRGVSLPVRSAQELDVASALERLFKLKVEGALTQDEFDAAKRKLLSTA